MMSRSSARVTLGGAGGRSERAGSATTARAASRERFERPVERPVPALPVEVAGVGDPLGVCACRARGVDRRLVPAIELLHGEQALVAACRKRVQHDALQAMVLGIVVRLAEDQVPRARGAVQ